MSRYPPFERDESGGSKYRHASFQSDHGAILLLAISFLLSHENWKAVTTVIRDEKQKGRSWGTACLIRKLTGPNPVTSAAGLDESAFEVLDRYREIFAPLFTRINDDHMDEKKQVSREYYTEFRNGLLKLRDSVHGGEVMWTPRS